MFGLSDHHGYRYVAIRTSLTLPRQFGRVTSVVLARIDHSLSLSLSRRSFHTPQTLPRPLASSKSSRLMRVSAPLLFSFSTFRPCKRQPK